MTLRGMVQGIEKALSELSQQQALIKLGHSSESVPEADAQPHPTGGPLNRDLMLQGAPQLQQSHVDQQLALPDQATGALHTTDVLLRPGLCCSHKDSSCANC